MPRSGSSWVGETLGLSPTTLYLGEPMTQTLLREYGKRPVCFELETDNLPLTYEDSLHHAMEGLPAFPKLITLFPEQWSLAKRKKKRVVTKEVNPFMLGWLIQNFHARIIYLIRHPVLVASSFERKSWRNSTLEACILRKTLQEKIPNYKQFTHSFMSEQGALQAFALNETLKMLDGYDDFKLVKYEDLCTNPIEQFKKLYRFAELEWNNTIERHILEHTQPSDVSLHQYNTYRNSTYEMEKWKHDVPKDKINELKEAYLSFDPPYYKTDWGD